MNGPTSSSKNGPPTPSPNTGDTTSQTLSQSTTQLTVAMLNVYYESMYYTAVSESPLMTVSDLLGVIGEIKIFVINLREDPVFEDREVKFFVFKIKRRSTRTLHWNFSLVHI